MTPAQLAELVRLRERVTALERDSRQAFAGGPIADTSTGATSHRPYQVGFAAELTSGYDATTPPARGYHWKRLFLDTSVPGLVDPAVQPAGDQAFEVSGDQTLQAGTRVWMEPSPDASGWVFQAGGRGRGPGETCGCCWVADLAREDVLRLTVDFTRGACNCLDASQVLYLRYDDVVGGWVSDAPFATCCGASEVLFFVDEGRPRLRDLETRGCCNPPAIPPGEFIFDCCDPCVVWFCGGGPCHCQGGSSHLGDLPGENLFRLKVECWPAAPPPPPPPPPPPGEVSCDLACPQVCSGAFLPDRVKVTVRNAGGTVGVCASVPPGGYTFYAWHDPTDPMPHLWKVPLIDEGTWGLHGYIECFGPCLTGAGEAYCGPPAFRGAGWCAETLLYAFACCTYFNQSSVIDSCSPFQCRIHLAVGFDLEIEDDSGACE